MSSLNAQIWSLHEQGVRRKQIAFELGVNYETVSRHLREPGRGEKPRGGNRHSDKMSRRLRKEAYEFAHDPLVQTLLFEIMLAKGSLAELSTATGYNIASLLKGVKRGSTPNLRTVIDLFDYFGYKIEALPK